MASHAHPAKPWWDLVREIPDAMKPRKIAINGAAPRRLEAEAGREPAQEEERVAA